MARRRHEPARTGHAPHALSGGHEEDRRDRSHRRNGPERSRRNRRGVRRSLCAVPASRAGRAPPALEERAPSREEHAGLHGARFPQNEERTQRKEGVEMSSKKKSNTNDLRAQANTAVEAWRAAKTEL